VAPAIAERHSLEVTAIGLRTSDAAARKPSIEFLIRHRRTELARQHVVGQPAAKSALGRLVERGHREVVDDSHPMPASAAARPSVTIQRLYAHPNLGGKMLDHRPRHIRLVVGKTAVLALKRELDREAELAGIDPAGEQR
jgi:hypothetical protein